MKKLLSAALALSMSLSSFVAFAKESPSLDFLKDWYSLEKTSTSQTAGSFEAKLNKPLEILDVIDTSPVDNYIDLKTFVEGLFDSTFTFTTKQKFENNGKKVAQEVHFTSENPIIVNDNLNLDVASKLSYWADVDFENPEKSEIIFSWPFGAKYITLPFDEMLNGEETPDITVLAPGGIEYNQLIDLLIDCTEKHATITGNSSKVTVTFTDAGLKLFLADYIAAYFEMSIKNSEEEISQEQIDFIKAQFEPFAEVMRKVPFFAKDALVMEFSLDSKGRISKEVETLNVDLNVYDIIKAFDSEADTFGLTKANSDIAFTFSATSNIQYNDSKIIKPTLNDKNSITIMEYFDPGYYDNAEPEDAEPEEYYFKHVWTDINEAFFLVENYIPVRNLLESFDYEIGFENGMITASSESNYALYDNLKLRVGSPYIITDKGTVTLSAPIVLLNNTTYIRMSDAEALMQSTATNYDFYFAEKSGTVTFERIQEEEDFIK